MTRRPASETRSPGFGVMLPTVDPTRVGLPPIRDAARLGEELAFDSLWVGDHLLFHCPYAEALTTLSLTAGITRDVTLGIGVMQFALRHPVWTAKQLSTMQWLSDDRLLVGIGVGGENVEEWEAAAAPHSHRGRVTDSWLLALPDALQGKSFGSDGAPTIRGLEPHGEMPPIWIGGRSEVAYRRAVMHGDGYLGLWMDETRIASAAERLAMMAAEHQRPVPSLALNVPIFVASRRADAESAARAYLDGVFRMPLERVAKYVVLGDVDEVAERLHRFLDAGASGLVALVAGPADLHLGQYEPLAEVRRRLLGAPRLESRPQAEERA